MKKYSLILFLIVFISLQASAENFLRGSDDAIRYMGRVIKSENGDVTFDWSGTYLTTQFTGGEIKIIASDTGKSLYNVFINGSLHKVITISGEKRTIELASGLKKNKVYHLRLQKRSEGEQGVTSIHGFQLSKTGILHLPPEDNGRWIEFIGDSLTTGYGSEGESADEPFSVETENCDITYACILSRMFEADYTLIAHSGRGVVRNYGDSLRTSSLPMKDRMMQTLDTDVNCKWDFKSYRPSLVVVNIGSNDFSTPPHPYKEEFIAGYRKIIEQIRDTYGKDMPIMCVCPRVGEPAESYIRELCQSIDDKNLYLRGNLSNSYNYTTDMGAAWHPNSIGHKKMAMILAPYISTIMNWDIPNIDI